MSWQPRSPMPPDFCGRPPCPKCYAWAGGDEPQSLAQFALELLGRAPNKGETKEAEKIARRMHKEGLNVSAAPDEEPPADTGATFVDIGMGSIEYQNRMLREIRQTPKPAPRTLTCDEIAERQSDRERRAKIKDKERQERLKEAREIAQVFADAQQQETKRREYEEQRMLRNVDPRFAEEMRYRGMSTREIYERWEYEQRGRSYMTMADPMKRYIP